MNKKLLILLMINLLSFSHSFANNLTTTSKATATLQAKCDISTTDLNLGNVIPGQPSSTATGTFNVRCTSGTTYKYYIGNKEYGTDCPYLNGAISGQKIPLGIKDLQINNYIANNYTGTGGANGSLISRTANGNNEELSFQAVIQPPYRDQFGHTFSSSCGTLYQSPGVNFNPYVTPDSYSTPMVFGIIY